MTSRQQIIVTGASRGIGLAIASRCVQDGFAVVAVSRSSSPELDNLIQASSPLVTHLPFDLSDVDLIPDLVRNIVRTYGVPYGLINNAAIGLDGFLATQHQSDIRRTLTVNLESPIVLSKYVLRHMLRSQSGRIISISSIVAETGFAGLSVYAATKAGVEGFTRSLAREVGKSQITVNAIAPGFIETDMTAGLEGTRLDAIRRRTPLDLARPTDIAGTVSFLLGTSGDRITGSIITIDGGSTA
jgi:3-oxoacyl-[acyl-carrier protein] reductase